MPTDDTLGDHRAWLGLTDCPCRFEFKSFSPREVKGWARVTTERECPHHGDDQPPLKPVPRPPGR